MRFLTFNALFISFVLHFLFFAAVFYIAVQNQPITSEKVGLTAEIISPKQGLQPKPPLRKTAPHFLTAERTVIEPEVRTAEMLPQAAVSPTVSTETPHPALGRSLDVELEVDKPSNALDLSSENWNAVSTAARNLRSANGTLSETESSSPAGRSSFGAKRPGSASGQRSLTVSTLKVAEEDVGFTPEQLAEIKENRKNVQELPFSQMMTTLAEEIVETSAGGPIDVVFVVDASGSMGDNIKSVVKHLHEMVRVYETSDMDYALGVTEFWAGPGGNVINVTQLTQNFTEFKQSLQAISTRRDENALDAVVETVRQLQFRPTSTRHFILVTDEPFTSHTGLEVEDTIAYCREFGVYVNVLGLPLDEHQALAMETGGKWHVIPDAPVPRVSRRSNNAVTPRDKFRSLRHAQWAAVSTIGDSLLQHGGTTPIDIVLFVDSSESMDAKLPEFLSQFDLLVRNLDNALIDYQIGVVRFRSRASVNIVNVFDAPQTLKQIHKILELPCREGEMLLDAIAEGLRRLKFRPNADPHFVLVTDEPATGAYSALAIIQMLQQRGIRVSVIGTYDDFQRQVATETGGVWVPIPQGHATNSSHW